MKLGFVSAIFPDLSLEEVIQFAAQEDFSCVELMCWPQGKAVRRYAGVTHIDVTHFKKSDVKPIQDLLKQAGVSISALGYYPNPLAPNAQEARVYINHLKKVIKAAALLGVKLVNTFIGRDWTKSVDDNWPRFQRVWPPLIQYA
jgi:sugar phosphate isomerase/epimerase